MTARMFARAPLKLSLAALSLVATLSFVQPALAAEGGVPAPKMEWSFNGPFGTYDRGALQRGFQVYKEVCAACHSMKLLSYRNLTAIGFTEDEVKALAMEATVIDGPNDEGEMFERPGRPADRFPSPYLNDNQARATNGGALPPDLSLIVKARPQGADYIHALLIGYTEPPAGEELASGQYWNTYFPGHKLSMAPPLMDGQVTYGDSTEASLDQMASDVATFLAFASEPHMEERKQMGVKVVLFLAIFSVILYAAKRKVWADVH